AERGEGRADLLGRALGRVDVGDAAGGAQHVEDRQVRDRAAIGQTAAFQPGGALTDVVADLEQQARLAHARLADNADHPTLALCDLSHQPPQRGRLSLAPDEAAARAPPAAL